MPKSPEIIDHAAYINNYMIDLILETIRAATGNYTISAKYSPTDVEKDPAIALQLYYNNATNKCYIEFRFNGAFKWKYNNYLGVIINNLHRDIRIKFRNDIEIWPEVILIEDSKHENCDSNPQVTPFTIGYWKSLSGRYEFLTDQIKILKDYSDMAFPTYPDAYMQEIKQLYDDYYTSDYNKFLEEMYRTNCDYNIRVDTPPKKDFRDFIDTIEEINRTYHQVMLPESDLNDFIAQYMDILTNYRENPLELKSKLNELYQTYGVITELQNKVPEIFEIYKQAYRDFMEKELETFEDVHDESQFIDPMPDDGTATNQVVEIWKYVGDFDFGDLDEGVDPETVASGDYNYNKAAEYIVFRSFYKIYKKRIIIQTP